MFLLFLSVEFYQKKGIKLFGFPKCKHVPKIVIESDIFSQCTDRHEIVERARALREIAISEPSLDHVRAKRVRASVYPYYSGNRVRWSILNERPKFSRLFPPEIETRPIEGERNRLALCPFQCVRDNASVSWIGNGPKFHLEFSALERILRAKKRHCSQNWCFFPPIWSNLWNKVYDANRIINWENSAEIFRYNVTSFLSDRTLVHCEVIVESTSIRRTC